MASGDSLVIWTPFHNEPTSASYMTLDTRNQHPVLDADASLDEYAVFSSVMPRAYSGGGVTVYVSIAMSSATSGCVDMNGAFEYIGDDNLDIDADSFASACTLADFAVPGTSGCVITASWAHADGAEMDSIAAGGGFRFKLGRSGSDDGATGDMEVLFVELKET